MEEIFSLNGLTSFLSLTLMEVVLGIDNIIFISILCNKLPKNQQNRARLTGISLAIVIRIILLFALTWIISLQSTIFTVFDQGFTGRDLILMGGGLFLIYKSTTEIHEKLEGEEGKNKKMKMGSFSVVILQIVLLDIIFSFDSILTAIGLVQEVMIMVFAVIIAMGIMLLAAKKISSFIHKHPTLKMLALSFLLLIGILLLVEGFHVHVPKGYVYFAIFFSLFVEVLNIRVKRGKAKEKPVQLKQKLK